MMSTLEKSSSKLISNWADQQLGEEQFIARLTEAMGKCAAVSFQVRLIGTVILPGQQVGGPYPDDSAHSVPAYFSELR